MSDEISLEATLAGTCEVIGRGTYNEYIVESSFMSRVIRKYLHDSIGIHFAFVVLSSNPLGLERAYFPPALKPFLDQRKPTKGSPLELSLGAIQSALQDYAKYLECH